MWRHSLVRGAGPLFVALGLVFVFSQVGGCYNPTIADGKLKCSDTTPPSCPDGFRCNQGLCFKEGGGTGGAPAGGSGGTGGAGTGGTAGTGGVGGTGGGTGGMCTMPAPLAGCVAPDAGVGGAGGCDFACQSGCGCNEKCSAIDDKHYVCQPIRGNVQAQDPCVITTDPVSQEKSDNCAPGLVCLSDGGTTARCFPLCPSGDSSYCSQFGPQVGPLCNGRKVSVGDSVGLHVCDVPFFPCVPGGSDPSCGNCYLSEPLSGVDRTVCEPWAMPGGENAPCFSSVDCISGNFYCPQNLADSRFHKCTRICSLPSLPCKLPLERCVPIGSSYGYCVL